MAVAVKNTPNSLSRGPLNRWAVESLLGALYILGCLGIVFYALPQVWWRLTGSASIQASVILGIIMVIAALGLVAGGKRLVGNEPTRGLAAGVFFGVIGVIVIGLLTLWIGSLLERSAVLKDPAIGLGIMAAVGLILLGLGVFAFFRPRFQARLVQVEDQGWFTFQPYKRNQGRRVRLGTIVGFLLLAAAGIYSLVAHNSLSTASWQVRIPFTENYSWIILPDVIYTLPLLLTFLAIWVAYRVVNFPVFADFLIATEAELNKVSWTSRKRLIQDTVVVLVTVLLLTIFLFVVDQAWAWLLSRIGVVQFPSGGSGAAGPGNIPY